MAVQHLTITMPRVMEYTLKTLSSIFFCFFFSLGRRRGEGRGGGGGRGGVFISMHDCRHK